MRYGNTDAGSVPCVVGYFTHNIYPRDWGTYLMPFERDYRNARMTDLLKNRQNHTKSNRLLKAIEALERGEPTSKGLEHAITGATGNAVAFK